MAKAPNKKEAVKKETIKKGVSKHERHGLTGEVAGIVVGALAVLIGASLYSESPTGNWIGYVGSLVAGLLKLAVGHASYEIPFLIFLISIKLLFRRYFSINAVGVIGLIIFLFTSSGLIGLFSETPATAAGIVGTFISAGTSAYIGTPGAFIVLAAILIISIIAITGLSFVASLGMVLSVIIGLVIWAIKGLISAIKGIGESDEEEKIIEKPKKKNPRSEPAIIEPTRVKTEPKVKEAKADKKAAVSAKPDEIEFLDPKGLFKLPPLSLLAPPDDSNEGLDKDELIANSKVLENKLNDFGVEGEVLEVRPGPVVTMYEFEPAPGIKVGKIINLANDLALAMKAASIRIVAPIPGKSVVGIEVPNRTRLAISFRELLEYPSFLRSQSLLSIAIGKEISGTPYVGDLARMPHLLIAGATGSGKSVFVNSLILSILFKATPEEVRFLMIDPKMLELSAYASIPHLLTPVITDPKKASGVLRAVVHEMERRYKLMADLGGKSVDTYNLAVDELTDGKGKKKRAKGEEEEENELEHFKLPYIVVVIDELADLMMTSGKDVEECIVRLSQMARAAGIHLVVATQRPSVDVITGLVKTNFPARMSFKVPSRTDSRTILDTGGAEALLGNGDMLFIPPSTSELKRLHGPYVSEVEIKRVTAFLRKQGKPTYDMDIAEAKAFEKGADDEDLSEEFLKRYDEAVALANEMETISTSYIQRRFRIGYNTAARIIERMEMDGVVGPSQGSRPREVLRNVR